MEYFIIAKSQAELLFVIVNSDFQRELKGSKEFQKEDERLFLVQHIKEVDQAFLSIDRDRTVCKTLEMLYSQFGSTYDLTFANGGDQNNDSIPEVLICRALGIRLMD